MNKRAQSPTYQDRGAPAAGCEIILRFPLGAGGDTEDNMAACTLTAKIEWAWWWPVYWNTIRTLAYLFDQDPNMDRVGYWMKKAIRITLVNEK